VEKRGERTAITMEPGIGREFIERTKHKYLGPSDQNMGVAEPPLEAPFTLGGETRPLPKPEGIETDLKRVIEQRTSVRSYEQTPLSQEELSYLLWCTQGVKAVEYGHTFRTVPSAGARHALETILLVNSVRGLERGLYRHRPLNHELQEYLLSDNVASEITFACLRQKFIARSAVTFIWVAVVDRMTWRYEQRGYRYLFLDVGHVCQNLYLASESIDCGACAVAAYDDDRMNEILHLDGTEAFVIYLTAVGKKRT
jgi:SagB-type dehydrogenase family enzyme